MYDTELRREAFWQLPLQQSERFTSRLPSIEPGRRRAGAKAQDGTGGVWRRNHCPNSKMHITVD